MADNKREPKMEQLFIELRNAIASDLDERFRTMEAKLEATLETKLETKLEEKLEAKLGAKLDTRRGAFEAKLDAKFAEQERKLTGVIVRQLETAERHLEDVLKVHVEDTRGLVTGAAEGYGATLDKIERELVDMHKKFDVGVTLPPAPSTPPRIGRRPGRRSRS